ncbi:MAG: retropepsin-like aspartic protease [Chloroflexota bacterium]
MKIEVQGGLPFVTVEITQGDKQLQLENVLLDTGSAGSIFSSDRLKEAGIHPQETAWIRRITGVGGDEFVVETAVDSVKVGQLQVQDFIIEAGAMDYSFLLDGILGFDFLQATQAVIDLGMMEIRK